MEEKERERSHLWFSLHFEVLCLCVKKRDYLDSRRKVTEPSPAPVSWTCPWLESRLISRPDPSSRVGQTPGDCGFTSVMVLSDSSPPTWSRDQSTVRQATCPPTNRRRVLQKVLVNTVGFTEGRSGSHGSPVWVGPTFGRTPPVVPLSGQGGWGETSLLFRHGTDDGLR